MERPRPISATIHHFPKRSSQASCLSPTTDCVRMAMSGALEGFEQLVSGKIEHGRAILSGEVASEAEKQLIERSVLRLHCVMEVTSDIVVHQPEPISASFRLPSRMATEAVWPILYRTSYCSLLEDTLTDAINDDLGVLTGELHGDAGPAEAIVFYYGWHSDAVLIDVAILAADALDRPRSNDVRASLLPIGRRCIAPSGGISGLRSAHQLLRLAAGAAASDQLFRIWQRVLLNEGTLPQDWLGAPLYSAQ